VLVLKNQLWKSSPIPEFHPIERQAMLIKTNTVGFCSGLGPFICSIDQIEQNSEGSMVQQAVERKLGVDGTTVSVPSLYRTHSFIRDQTVQTFEFSLPCVSARRQ
jgi:hypothetical protein